MTVSSCVICFDDYPTEEMFWVDYEKDLPKGYYCYECDANLVAGVDEDED